MELKAVGPLRSLQSSRSRAALTEVAHEIVGDRRQTIIADAMLLGFGFDQRDLPDGDLAQGRDDFLIIRFDQRTGALEQLFGPARGSEDQFESIRNLFETIFYSYTGHSLMIFRPRAAIVNEPYRSPRPSYFSAGNPLPVHSAYEPSKSLESKPASFSAR